MDGMDKMEREGWMEWIRWKGWMDGKKEMDGWMIVVKMERNRWIDGIDR